MATAQLTDGRGGSSAEHTAPAAAPPQAPVRVPLSLAAAHLAVILYAAFDHGAVALAPGTWVEVAIALTGAMAAVAWLGLDALVLPRSRLALGALALVSA